MPKKRLVVSSGLCAHINQTILRLRLYTATVESSIESADSTATGKHPGRIFLGAKLSDIFLYSNFFVSPCGLVLVSISCSPRISETLDSVSSP